MAIEIRRAAPPDRAGIEALMDREYGAYNPYWDELDGWMADRVGLLAVAVDGERVVGFGKLSRLSPSEWWVESIVVDGDYRRKGVATRLCVFGFQYYLSSGGGCFRAMVADYNDPMFRFMRQFDFARSVGYRHWTASPIPGAHELRPLAPGEVDRALDVLERAPPHRAARGLVERRWKWRGLDRDLLRELTEAGEAFRWRDEGVALLWRRRGPSDAEVRVWTAWAGDEGTALARDVRRLAGEWAEACGARGVVHWRIPDDSGIDDTLAAAGYAPRVSFENQFYVIELRQRDDP